MKYDWSSKKIDLRLLLQKRKNRIILLIWQKAVYLNIHTFSCALYCAAAQQMGLYQNSCRRHNPRPKRMILRWLIYRNSSKCIDCILDVHDVKDFRKIIQGVETFYTSRVGRFDTLFRSRTFLWYWNVNISGEGPVCLATKAFNQERDFIVLHNQGL